MRFTSKELSYQSGQDVGTSWFYENRPYFS